MKPDWVVKLRPCLKTPTRTQQEQEGAKGRVMSEAEKERGLPGEERKRKRKVNGMETKQERGRKEPRQEETSQLGDNWREREKKTPERQVLSLQQTGSHLVALIVWNSRRST